MDLIISDRNINKEKRTNCVKNPKKKVLSQNNNFEDIYSSQESDEEFEKSYSLDLKSKGSEDISENQYNESLFGNSIDGFIKLFAKTLKFEQKSDPIHDRYQQYCIQSQTQKDLSKTDYTYAHSFSYNKLIDSSKQSEWDIPNMSRRTTSSVKNLQMSTNSSIIAKNEISMESKSSSIHTSQTITGRESSQSSESRRTPTAQMFTRSQCLGGAQCEAPDCQLHKNPRRRTGRSEDRSARSGITIPGSGPGLEPEIEFSEDDDYIENNRLNRQRLSSYRQNGYPYHTETDESEDEVITYIKRVTNIFRTTINSTSGFIDSITPITIKKVKNKCPSLWLLFSILLFLSPLVYVMSLYKSSLWSENSLDALTGDVSSKYAINQLIKELKELKYDLRTLKDSNDEMKLKMKSNEMNEINGNEKMNDLNDKIDSIEDYLNNIMKNCCRNETDSMLALIDWRLSQFMASMLTENSGQLTASEAAQELKAFIRLELSKTNHGFKESVEQKLMSTIERVENQMNQKSDHLSSNITINEIKSLISEALAVYDADKTGQPDFALEPAGGTIINTRCSETFDPYGVQYKIFGMPVWSSSVSPRAVIQPTISPGECWAFKGSNGYLVIKLSQPIITSAFSYEHIPKQISRDGNINSAPKEFQVRGLEDESDTSGHLLGNYIYEDNGRPMQYFEVQDPNPRVFQFIELVILSNHGHSDYTCLYRFRVHGKRVGH